MGVVGRIGDMNTSGAQLAKLRQFIGAVRRGDKELAEETPEQYEEVAQSEETIQRGLDDESIVMRRLRPVLAIKGGTTELAFVDAADSEVWKDRLAKAKSLLDTAIPAVGRIEARGYPGYIGTGWLVEDSIVVTNRHV